MDDTLLKMIQLAQKGYYCSQIIMLMGLEAKGETNRELVRAMAGLAYGCGGSRGTCGALTGAASLLALYAGKGDESEEESPHLMMMLEELSAWFAQRVGGRYGGIACEAIVGQEGPAAARHICGSIVAETYAKAMELLLAHGFDPTGV